MGKEDIKGMLNQIELENQKSKSKKCEINAFGKPIEIVDQKMVEIIEKMWVLVKTQNEILEK